MIEERHFDLRLCGLDLTENLLDHLCKRDFLVRFGQSLAGAVGVAVMREGF
jgi:hypothetical protein